MTADNRWISGQAQSLATLLHLARRAREAKDATELDFIAVNETHAIAPYRQAALWMTTGGVTALSGVVSPEANAPYLQWLGRIFHHLKNTWSTPEPHVLSASDLPAGEGDQWSDWLPRNGLWLPLPPIANHFAGGALLLTRDEPWTQAECLLLKEWVAIWCQARALMTVGPLFGRTWQRLTGQPGFAQSVDRPADWRSRIRALLSNWRLWFTLALVATLVIPVRLSVLAPAELVPLKPAFIRAPLDGVIDRVLVIPNQNVRKDQPLFEFDRANLQSRLQIAIRALATVRAEYRQKAQQALFDSASKADLAILQGQIAEKDTEVKYLRQINERGVVVSPRVGIVLFGDPTEWVGRPVITGERVMVVADEHAAEIEAWLSPADAIPLREGATLKLYLNADPLHPVTATLRYIAHEATERPDGHYAYRVRATLTDHEAHPRVGLKGTAKLLGEKVSLAYWMLRRPLAAARAWVGM